MFIRYVIFDFADTKLKDSGTSVIMGRYESHMLGGEWPRYAWQKDQEDSYDVRSSKIMQIYEEEK